MANTKSMDPFDYPTYTLDELLDARKSINEDRFPERVLQLDIEIQTRKRQLEEDPSIEARPPSPKWPLLVVGGGIIAMVGLALVLIVPKALAQKKILTQLNTDLTEEYTDATSVVVAVGKFTPEELRRESKKSEDSAQEQASPKTRVPQGPNQQLTVTAIYPEVLEYKYEEKRALAFRMATSTFERWENKKTIGQVEVNFIKEKKKPVIPGNKFSFKRAEFADLIDSTTPSVDRREAG